ncbi:ABC transporter ATP-binding protein [Gleimia europaea]|uniref:ABC transporter domain-containing protein n=1 Tax=Gleimia europaea ACS-120-V-Col10b TaxID=883069 RepID=A0A9W5VW16_9ACTO|nr:ABC transporter ATP-binding protein [Gleimia europaea]EPD30410.1 hypothetical protein HMPREF9238_00148 [Gleimia europaea ACS-120-V-Col10b]
MKPSLSLQNLNLNRHGRRVLQDIDLAVYPGELVVLLGPSGAGKSTLLRVISGLTRPGSGTVRMGDKDVSFLPPQQRPSAMVMDSPALFGHMTVQQNIAFAVNRDLFDSTPDEQILVAMTVLNIRDLAYHYPAELSTGQRQKVSLARTLVRRPQVLLFDEPLAHVDAFSAKTLRSEILRVHKRMNCASIYITHDVKEAFSIADRIIYMEDGRIVQDDLPQEIHDGPATLSIAKHLGATTIISASANARRLVSGQVVANAHVLGNNLTIAASPYINEGEEVPIVIVGYPDSVDIQPAKSASRFPIRGNIGQIVQSIYTGETYRLRIETERGAISAEVQANELAGSEGERVSITLREDLLWALPAQT